MYKYLKSLMLMALMAAIVTGCGTFQSVTEEQDADTAPPSAVKDVKGRAPAAAQPTAAARVDQSRAERLGARSAEEGKPEAAVEEPARAADYGGAAAGEKAPPPPRTGGAAPADEAKSGIARRPLPERRRQPPSPPDFRRPPEIPPPPPRDMYFRDYGVNPWEDASKDPLSTFAMDVDTGSYTLARRYLLEGSLPPIESVRVEEFVNYFEQDYPPPERGAFAIHVDGAPSPWGDDGEYLVRIGIQGRRVREATRRDAVLTFVVDVSGSMEMEGRLELVKDALVRLTDQLQPGDEIAIVAYTDDAWVVLPATEATDRRRIVAAINELYPMNSTNAEAGLELGYDLAEEAYRRGAINRVILCSDGVANVGATGPEQILRRIKPAVERGITLTSIGVGMGNYNDVLMEQLADQGDGSYYYVDDLQEAERVFVENLTGTLQVIARDAKVQVEFDPEFVEAYRLIGYENREVADRDFEDDRVDAGEIGAGHSVTALYAVIMWPEVRGRLATVRVRYEDPDEGNVREVEETLDAEGLAGSFRRAGARFRMTASVAAFAEILRDSYYTRGVSVGQVIEVAEDAARDLRSDQEVQELVQLMRAADRLAMR